MIKCGKGCMPECQYFTTGGCVSPFNCPYKIETGYINSATSTLHNEGIKDYKHRAGVAEVLLALIDYQFGKMKHRAEVAERALGFICDKAMKNHDIIVFPEDGTQTKNKAELFIYCIERAERDLAEERKDD